MLTATRNSSVGTDRDYRYSDKGYADTSYGNDRTYARTAKETTDEYREHLYESLLGKSRARGSYEYDDERRYDSISREAGAPARANRRNAYESERAAGGAKASRRVFKKKLIPLVACYFLMVAVVVALIAVNVSGTAWETETIRISNGSNIVPTETASAITNPGAGEIPLNTIMTSAGAVQVSLSPYPASNTYTQDTNWFDRFCDWISNLVGG